MNAIRPPASPYKWVGGKSRLLAPLLEVIPDDFGTYFEPCFGGGALFWELSAQGRITHAVLADASPVVAEAMQGLRSCVGGVIGALQVWQHRASWDPQGALHAVQALLAHPHKQPAYEVAAALLAHQALGFNGLWRVNRAGKPNVALGRDADGQPNQITVDADLLIACAAVLQWAEVHHHVAWEPGLFRPAWSLPIPDAGDLVYIDPPYLPMGRTADFAGYTSGGFGWRATCELARWAAAAKARGVHVVISNSDSPGTVEAFGLDDPGCVWRVKRITRSGSVSCDTTGRGQVGEVLLW